MRFIQPESICRIEAYKLDLLCFDSIAFDIHLRDGGVVWFCEEDATWKLIEGMVQSLPLLDSDWRRKVAFPAFEERRMVIYDANSIDVS